MTSLSAQPSATAVIILAAGRSRRMGTPKPLLPLGPGTLIERVVDTALETPCRPVLVVTGAETPAIAPLLAGRSVAIIENRAPDAGLSASLRLGIESLPADVAAAIICLADMPDISARLLDRLAAAFDPAAEAEIIVPVSGGRRGNPVLWGRRFFAELCTLKGDRGGRDLIARHCDFVREIDIAGTAIFTDLDTPDALAHWRANAGRRASPQE